MRARSCLLALALLGGVAPLGAQPEPEDRSFFRPSTRAISLDFEAGGVFDTNIDQNAAEVQSQGFVARVILEAQKPARNRLFHVRYIGDVQSYTGSDRWDRGTSDVTAMYYQSLTRKLTLTAIGGYSLRGPTEEQLPANHYSGWSQLRYRASRAAEIGVYGSYRWVRPEDDAGDENVLVAGLDFGGDIGRRSVWEIGYQREQSDSPAPARRYRADKFRAEYALKAGDRTSFGVRLVHARRLFPETRFVVGEIAMPRRDERWTPSAFWLYRFDSGKRLTVRWELRDRSTNYGRGAWSGQRLDAVFRVPLVGRRRTPRPPGDGFPLPKLPDGVPTPDPPILDQLTYLSTTPEFSPERRPSTDDGPTFTRGSHWKEVLSGQGVPTGISEKPQFFEDIWQYGPSWVTFNNGRVVSWHDAGNLKLRPEPREKKTPPPPRRRSEPRAAAKGPAPDLVKIEDTGETISSAFLRVAEPEIVLADGTRLKGVLRKYDNGLAHVLLFLDNGRTLLATMPEHLIDKGATNPLPTLPSDEGKH